MKLNPSPTTRSVLTRLAVASTLSFALFGACKNDPKVGDDPNGGTSCTSSKDCKDSEFCSTTLNVCKAECESCGMSCQSLDDCPLEQYCTAENECQRDCIPADGNDQCGEGNRCTENGQCVAKGSIDIGGGGETGMGGDTNMDCIDVKVDFAPQIPNVVLLIDQSGSMNSTVNNLGDYVRWEDGTDPPGGCPSNTAARWNIVRDVLLNPDTGVVKPLEDVVRFGLALYTGKSATCPKLTEVDIDFGTHADMLTEFTCNGWDGDTPTRESLTAVAESLAAQNLDGPKVIVLATDGEPDTCECENWDAGSGSTCACTDENKIMLDGNAVCPSAYEQYLVATEAARIHDELGITIEVINIGAPGLKDHLDSVAEQGGAVSGASIDGTSPSALTDAFNTIIDGVRSCAIDLDGEISPGKESTGRVTLDGTALKLNDKDGWKVNNPKQIELVGDACDTIKTGDHALDVSFPCGSFVVNPR